MNFSGVITNAKSDVHAKGQNQRSKVKVTEVKTQLSRFWTVTPVWIHIWQWNDAQSLIMLRRGAVLFLKVICQISRSHGTKNRWFWPKLSVSGLLLKFEFTNGYEMMHKAGSSIEEVPYCFWKSSVKFQGHTGQKMADFDPNLAFPDCNSSLNWPMAMKWCTKLWSSIGEVPYCFSRSSIKFQGHTGQKKSPIFTWIEYFRIVTPVWIY